jgi:hypothetical protein
LIEIRFISSLGSKKLAILMTLKAECCLFTTPKRAKAASGRSGGFSWKHKKIG